MGPSAGGRVEMPPRRSAAVSSDPLVRQIMSTPVQALKQDAKISEARKGLAMSPFHHLPVLDEEARVIGILSASDLLRISLEAYDVDPSKENDVLDRQFKLAEVMKTDVVMIKATDSIRSAALKLSSGSIHSLPVVDEERRLLGMITSTDMIDYLLKLLPPE